MKCTSINPPKYRLHRASGQAVCTIGGRDHYLGPHGSPESYERHKHLVGAWLLGDSAPTSVDGSDTVVELCNKYLAHAEKYYSKHGKPTTELANIKRAIKTLRQCYGSLPARDFSPVKLKVVRQRFIDDGLCRTNVNRFISIIGRIFRWAVENELVPPSLAHGLEAVQALSQGRCGAPEMDPVLPVTQETINATLPHLSAQHRAMVQVQVLLACRPGELVQMRPRDIDRGAEVWTYRPASHKTEHKGKSRTILIGPRAQALLQPWLDRCDAPDAYIWPSQRGDHLTAAGYAEAVRAACRRAGIETWSPNRLRHSGATNIRAVADLETARIALGHSSAAMTQRYAEVDFSRATAVALKIG
jgi:integrase